MLCRACEKPFRKALAALGVEDESCPHCGTAFVLPARCGASESSTA